MNPQSTTTGSSTTISYGSTGVSFNPSGTFTIPNNQALTVNFGTFPTGSNFTKLVLQSQSNAATRIVYTPGQQTGTANVFTVSANNTTAPVSTVGLVITITDIEGLTGSSTETFQLAIQGSLGTGGSWEGDPEVINKAGSGSSGERKDPGPAV